MIRMHRRISGAVTVLTMAAIILTGCTSEASSISSAKNKTEDAGVVDTGFTMSTVGSYDSADTAVVLSTDETNKAVTFINMETGKQYTLYYDGTTYVKDKHDGPMTISQIVPGDVVDVTFLKGKKRLASIKLSPEAWVYDDVYNYDLAGANRTASIGSQSYSLPESVVVLSEGRRVDKAEVVSQDVVTISGIDHKIYSVSVDKGHGYLSLKNEQPLLGGWIEVGNSVIRQISEDMLLVVPEGTYQVTLSNNGIGCVKNITVERDKEVVLDVDDLEIPEDATGKILFSVTPENATVSVDGKPVDISKVVELSYGIHRVEASASGYDTLTKHIQVGSEYATISFKLEESRKEDNSVSRNSITRDPWQDSEKPEEDNSVDVIETTPPASVSDNALRSSKNGTVEVHVRDWDTGAELKGVTVQLEVEDSKKKILDDYPKKKTSPCSFSKNKDGDTYQFILSMDGYETKTFEPDLEDYQKDETLYFMLKKKETSTPTNNNSNTRISTDVITAVAQTRCDLTNGSTENTGDAYATSAKVGNLWKTGKEKLNEAVKNAVQGVVGTQEIGSYYFKAQDSLKDVVAMASGDYEATASVIVGRSGYREETISVRVTIKQEAVEKKIGVIAYPDKDVVGPGDTVTFTAEVKDGEETVKGAVVSWSYSEDCNFDGMVIEDGNTLVIEVQSVEAEEVFEAVATYTDVGGNAFASDPVSVTVKNPEEKPETPDPENPDNTGGNNQGGENQGNTEGDNQDGGNQGGTSGDNQDGGDQGDTSGDNQNGGDQGGASGDNQNGGDQGETSGDNQNGGDQDGTNGDNQNGVNSSDTTTQTFSMTQNAHPIRNFFSSLFK